jgi:hypothetical protein
MDLVDHISEEFSTAELTIVAEAVGLSPAGRWGSRRLVDAIIAKLNREIPAAPLGAEEAWERPEILVEDFLFVAGFTDETGKRIKTKEKKGGMPDAELGLEEFMSVNNIKKEPDCFSFADDADPACKRCILYRFCAEERVASLPDCFGILYDRTDAQCKKCLEAPFCKTDEKK